MKKMKKLSVLAAGSIAIGLQLFTSMALAEEVCLDGDTAMGIKGLDVLTDQYGPRTIDVDFTYATGYEVYGSGLDNFPFTAGNAEEDLIAINAQINASLNANSAPGSAGQPGQDTYFVGGGEDDGFIGGYGSENLGGNLWDKCSVNGCILGVKVLNPNDRYTYAELSSAAGGSCGNKPPDPEVPPTGSYNIVPCITGSWFLLARDGEGYNIEIYGDDLDPQLLAYFYTYDDDGNQMWLVGAGPANGDTAVVPVQVTSGPDYSAYDPADVLREDWGTLTFKFTSKDTGTVVRASTMAGFGTTTVDINRLTSVTGLACP